jgi:hypothetical protein
VNQDRVKWRPFEYFRFNLCQTWIWFRETGFQLPIPVQKDNWFRNLGLQNRSNIQGGSATVWTKLSLTTTRHR